MQRLAPGLFRRGLALQSTIARMAYSTEERGSLHSEDYRLFISKLSASFVSRRCDPCAFGVLYNNYLVHISFKSTGQSNPKRIEHDPNTESCVEDRALALSLSRQKPAYLASSLELDLIEMFLRN